MLLVNKKKGLSSFAVVKAVRSRLGGEKVGHAGTLDPLAEGLLIILIGKKETKKAQEFLSMRKLYSTVARVGLKTSSGDLEGEVLNTLPAKLSEEEVKEALKRVCGEKLWPVPLYSAVKVKGKALYKYAREGKSVEPPKKKMHIYSTKFLKLSQEKNFCDIEYELEVSSGTYVRTVNEKIGEILSYPSTSAAIKRLKIGEFHLKDAIDSKSVFDKNFDLSKHLIPL